MLEISSKINILLNEDFSFSGEGLSMRAVLELQERYPVENDKYGTRAYEILNVMIDEVHDMDTNPEEDMTRVQRIYQPVASQLGDIALMMNMTNLMFYQISNGGFVQYVENNYADVSDHRNGYAEPDDRDFGVLRSIIDLLNKYVTPEFPCLTDYKSFCEAYLKAALEWQYHYNYEIESYQEAQDEYHREYEQYEAEMEEFNSMDEDEQWDAGEPEEPMEPREEDFVEELDSYAGSIDNDLYNHRMTDPIEGHPDRLYYICVEISQLIKKHAQLT